MEPNSGGHTASAAKRQSEAELGGAAGAVGRDGGGRAASAAKWHPEAESGSAAAAAVPNSAGHTASAAKRLAYADGLGAVGQVEQSPALKRHLAALRCVGGLPESRSRYIPAAVRREVWRRDRGRCSYVPHHSGRESGRRCGSRYRLEIDHIVPFALGGANELSNLRLHCEAHHRLRHGDRESLPTEGRRAAVCAVDHVEGGQTVGAEAMIGVPPYPFARVTALETARPDTTGA